MTHRESLIQALKVYNTRYREEAAFVSSFLSLLSQQGCYNRDHLPGHITGSAWIVNTAATRVLLVQHAFLKRWLQPGGHADGNDNILETARREAFEETGLDNLELAGNGLFDIDIHPIPAKINFPAHDHYDVRFLFISDERKELTISDESTDLKWVELDSVEHYNSERSILRLRDKVISRLSIRGQRPR